MIAKILVSQSLEQRQVEILEILQENNLTKDHPDVFYLPDEEKLGVAVTKKIREFLSFKPNKARGRGVVLESAQNLTSDAQNSLLKTLEEPPEDAVLILGVEKESQLLPTVLSRCELVILNDPTSHPERSSEGSLVNTSSNQLRDSSSSGTQNDNYIDDIERLQGTSVEERFEYIEKLEDKEGFFKAMVSYYRSKLPENLEFSKKLLEAERWQSANVNIRAILEYLMLELPFNP